MCTGTWNVNNLLVLSMKSENCNIKLLAGLFEIFTLFTIRMIYHTKHACWNSSEERSFLSQTKKIPEIDKI